VSRSFSRPSPCFLGRVRQRQPLFPPPRGRFTAARPHVPALSRPPLLPRLPVPFSVGCLRRCSAHHRRAADDDAASAACVAGSRLSLHSGPHHFPSPPLHGSYALGPPRARALLLTMVLPPVDDRADAGCSLPALPPLVAMSQLSPGLPVLSQFHTQEDDLAEFGSALTLPPPVAPPPPSATPPQQVAPPPPVARTPSEVSPAPVVPPIPVAGRGGATLAWPPSGIVAGRAGYPLSAPPLAALSALRSSTPPVASRRTSLSAAPSVGAPIHTPPGVDYGAPIRPPRVLPPLSAFCGAPIPPRPMAEPLPELVSSLVAPPLVVPPSTSGVLGGGAMTPSPPLSLACRPLKSKAIPPVAENRQHHVVAPRSPLPSSDKPAHKDNNTGATDGNSSTSPGSSCTPPPIGPDGNAAVLQSPSLRDGRDDPESFAATRSDGRAPTQPAPRSTAPRSRSVGASTTDAGPSPQGQQLDLDALSLLVLEAVRVVGQPLLGRGDDGWTAMYVVLERAPRAGVTYKGIIVDCSRTVKKAAQGNAFVSDWSRHSVSSRALPAVHQGVAHPQGRDPPLPPAAVKGEPEDDVDIDVEACLRDTAFTDAGDSLAD